MERPSSRRVAARGSAAGGLCGMVVRHSAIPHAGKLRPATPLPATPLLVALLLAALLLAGCDGPQSTLDPAGGGARRIAGLFLVMAVGAGVLWVAVIGLAVYADRKSTRLNSSH